MAIVTNTLKLFALSFIVTLGFLVMFALMALSQVPSNKQIKGCLTTKLYKVRLCSDSNDYVRLREIAPILISTVVLAEDSSFWSHNGFDFVELQRSMKQNLEEGRYARGGSTISQQLAKNLFLTSEKTMTRKLMEAVITMQIEKVLTKKEILEKYLNVVQFGKGLFGIKRASQFYFKKHPRELSVLEAAFLTFLLPGPESYSKSFFKKELTPFARERLTQIIEKLYVLDRIDQETYEITRHQMRSMFGANSDDARDAEGQPVDFESIMEEEI